MTDSKETNDSNDMTNNALTSLFATPDPEPESNLDAAIDADGQLLGALGTPIQEGEAMSIYELAVTEVSSLPAIRSRADAIASKSKAFTITEAEDVQSVCDALDSMIGGDNRLTGFDLAQVRNYVQMLMVTLKVNPEFGSILLDRDVRNVIRFARQQYLEAVAVNGIAETKKATRSVKSGSTAAKKAIEASKLAKANEILADMFSGFGKV